MVSAAGREMQASGHVPVQNLFSYVEPLHPWLMHEWLVGPPYAAGLERFGPSVFVAIALGVLAIDMSIAHPRLSLDARLETVHVFRMNLAVRVLMSQIEELARARGFEQARVLSKVNRHGELVIGVLIPPRTLDEWGTEPAQTREQKRLSRERR